LIAGKFTFSDIHLNSVTPEHCFSEPDVQDLSFKTVEVNGFKGVYCLNRRLPFSNSDFIFSDISNDIYVLARADFYNKKELLPEIFAEQSIPLPLLISELFLRDGPDFVKKVNGDFAIFIWRPLHREAYIFRDHVGIAPVSYAVDGDNVLFSSDPVGLAKAFSGSENIDAEYLLGYFKYIDYRKTPLERVKKVPPGHYIHFTAERVSCIKYWFPEKIKTDRKMSHDEFISRIDQLVRDAVKIRCDTGFNAGAHVSGGLDSVLVATLVCREYEQQDAFYGFSWSPADYKNEKLKYDERQLAKNTCDKAGITPVFNDFTAGTFLCHVNRYLENHGYFHEERVTEQAEERGVNLIFSGWGGDEFISTGNRGTETDLLRGLHLKTFFRRNRLLPLRRFVKWMLVIVVNPFFGIPDKSSRRSFRKDVRYLREGYKKSHKRTIHNYYYYRSRRQMHLGMLNFYHLQERCESWAVMGYNRGIVYRYPLLDRRIIEYMLRTPSVLLCTGNDFRPVLREIGKNILPEDVRTQKLKSDPFCWGYTDDMSADLSEQLMGEVPHWEKNKELGFVDFEMLINDIQNYRKNPALVDLKVLSKSLIYIKALNTFTERFRSRQS